MKNIIKITLIVLISGILFSCKKPDAKKDVKDTIIKLKQFNNKFNELYTDGQISKDTIEGSDKSEYDELKKIASEYYDVMNRVNNAKNEEKEDNKDKYTKEYESLLEEKKSEIEENASK
ncbi:MAG: hypothetical protein GY756_13315, partial [bacterium]|nr:hypothetical protein [bacterium]